MNSEDRVRQLEDELARTRQALAEMQVERDGYKKFLDAEMAKNLPSFNPQDFANAVPARPWLEDLIQKLENS